MYGRENLKNTTYHGGRNMKLNRQHEKGERRQQKLHETDAEVQISRPIAFNPRVPSRGIMDLL